MNNTNIRLIYIQIDFTILDGLNPRIYKRNWRHRMIVLQNWDILVT